MWKAIGVILEIIRMVLGAFLDKDKRRKKEKKEAVEEISDGIKKNDTNRVISGFDHLNRVR